MPAIVACPKCKTKYQLPDSMLGKPIKCKSCGTAFQPNVAPKTSAAGKPKGAGKPASSQPGGGQQPAAAELAKFGIDGPLRRQSTDVFAGAAPVSRQGPDLLGNLAAEPGFGELEPSAKPRKRRDEHSDDVAASKGEAEFLKNPALRPVAKKKKNGAGKKNKGNQPYYKNVWQLALVVFSILLLVSVALSWFVPSLAAIVIATYMVILMTAVSAAGIWNLVECYQAADSVGHFLMVLIPFYIIYFWVKQWPEVSKSATAYLVLTLAIVPASYIVFLVCAIMLATAPDAG